MKEYAEGAALCYNRGHEKDIPDCRSRVGGRLLLVLP